MTYAAMLLLASFGGVDQPLTGSTEKTGTKVEFRRAETSPAEGLVEATVPGSRAKVYLHKAADLTNDDISEVRSVDDSEGRPAIEFVLTEEGTKKMEKLTENHLDKPLAILLDGKVVSAPTVRQKISGRALMSGKFTKEEVDRIVEGIKGE